MEDPLKDCPRLGADAMAPCVVCGRQLLETAVPLFFRIKAKLCGLDAAEIRRHVGLAQSMGGGTAGLVLAGVLGPGVKPIVVMNELPGFNVCNSCASDPHVMLADVIGAAYEGARKALEQAEARRSRDAS